MIERTPAEQRRERVHLAGADDRCKLCGAALGAGVFSEGDYVAMIADDVLASWRATRWPDCRPYRRRSFKSAKKRP